MKNVKKILVLLLIILIPFNVYSDSGWDYSYDSGGSSYSGSSSSSSSSTSRNHSSSVNSYYKFLYITLFFWLFFGVPVLLFISNRKSKNKFVHFLAIDSELNTENINKIAFNIYKEVQEAWMNFDYKSLEALLTDELYNNYKMQLEVLESEGKQNIMEDISLTSIFINNIQIVNNTEIITVLLNVKQKDYIIDKNTKELLRGDRNIHFVSYKITLMRNIDIIKNCPSCGAEILDQNHIKCDYCGTIITRKSNKFVMSKKEISK